MITLTMRDKPALVGVVSTACGTLSRHLDPERSPSEVAAGVNSKSSCDSTNEDATIRRIYKSSCDWMR